MQKKVFPQFKKDIRDFLLKEEASMIKKDVVKAGMGLLVLSLGMKAGIKTDAASGQCYNNCPCVAPPPPPPPPPPSCTSCTSGGDPCY
jgi:hypothetical protein